MAKKGKKGKGSSLSKELVTGKVLSVDKDKKTTRLITPAFIASYCNLLEARTVKDSDRKTFSVAMVFDKDKRDMSVIEDAIKLATPKKTGRNFKFPLYDGDEEYPDDENFNNSVFINTNCTRRPGIRNFGPALKQVMELHDLTKEEALALPVDSDDDSDGIYSGCLCRASVTITAYDQGGGRGISAFLNNVQVLDRRERIGGGASAESDFGELEDISDLDLDSL